jgi:hypothetical protein
VPKAGLKVAIVALALALVAQAAAMAHALPWPPLASTTLAGLFLLVALTRMASELGVRGQKHTPHAVAGVAATGAFWYAGAALVMARPELAVLAVVHVVAAALAFGRPSADAASNERAWLVAASTGAAVSLVAVSALPHEVGVPGATLVPSLLAVAMLFGAWFLGTGRMVGLVLTAASGTVTLVLVARVLSRLVEAGDLAAGMPLRLAPMLLTTAALGAAPAVIAMALRLDPMWKVLLPKASARVRRALVVATLPVLAVVAVLAF